MKTEAYFIPHCDDFSCDLGAFQYTCPNCNKTSSDYEVWWKQDDIWNETSHKFNCNECNQQLIVKWDKEEYQYLVCLENNNEKS